MTDNTQTTAIQTLPAWAAASMPALPEDVRAQLIAKFAPAMSSFGNGINRLSIRSSRFRLIEGGNEEVLNDTHLDIIVLGIGDEAYHMYFKSKYDANADDAKPDFVWGENDPHPAAVPTEKDAEGRKQYSTRRRIVFTRGKFDPATGTMDIPQPDKLYVFDVNAISMFGNAHPAQGMFNMGQYVSTLRTQGMLPCAVLTRLVFNTQESVPAVFFTPFRDQNSGQLIPLPGVLLNKSIQTVLGEEKRIADMLDFRRGVDAPAEAQPQAQQPQAPQFAQPQAQQPQAQQPQAQ